MILVTGATGLVGGHLLWHLLQIHNKVVAIRRKTSSIDALKAIFSFYGSDVEALLQKIEWREADVLDLDSLSLAFQDIDIVYHCAAVVSLSSGSETMTDTNVSGTKNIVELALQNNITKLCYVSSIAACGQSVDNNFIDENTNWKNTDNRNAYSRSKYYAELEVWKGIEKGLNAVIVNPGVILGVSGSQTGSSQIFFQVKKGLAFYTSGGTGYVDVRDVVRLMILLLTSEISGERFIVVSENCNNKKILSWMADGFGKKRPQILISKRPMMLIGSISEFAGQVFRFKPLIDKSMARSVSHLEKFSNEKVKIEFSFDFIPIKTCIAEVCESIRAEERK